MNKKLEFPICDICHNRHYRKAGAPCEFKGVTNNPIKGIRYLKANERFGFACNTSNCPCSADYGKIIDTDDVSDVRCEDCAKDLGWLKTSNKCPKCNKPLVSSQDWGDYDDAQEWACMCKGGN